MNVQVAERARRVARRSLLIVPLALCTGCDQILLPIQQAAGWVRHSIDSRFSGADGVFLGACPPGDCHYINGNRYAQQRINVLRGMLADSGFDPRRLRMEWITPDDPHDFVAKIADFTKLIRALGSSPTQSEQTV